MRGPLVTLMNHKGSFFIKSKVHRQSLNLLWCVIPVPKLAKCTDRSSNLLIVSFESQIYLNNLLNLLRPRDHAEPGTSRSRRARAGPLRPLGLAGATPSWPHGRARADPPRPRGPRASSSAATSRACARRGKATQGLRPSPRVRCSPGAITLSMARRRRWLASGRTWSRKLSRFNRLFK
jgi:hypothetical protein